MKQQHNSLTARYVMRVRSLSVGMLGVLPSYRRTVRKVSDSTSTRRVCVERTKHCRILSIGTFCSEMHPVMYVVWQMLP